MTVYYMIKLGIGIIKSDFRLVLGREIAQKTDPRIIKHVSNERKTFTYCFIHCPPPAYCSHAPFTLYFRQYHPTHFIMTPPPPFRIFKGNIIPLLLHTHTHTTHTHTHTHTHTIRIGLTVGTCAEANLRRLRVLL